MDAVITYVDGSDPLWQRQYAESQGSSIISKRFRAWGTLKYLFRAIEKNLPFIRTVHLVVSAPSQVPDWVSPKVHVVLHKDIIPSGFLPTFSSRAIELFLHRIPGLDEEYLYFNDDMFPLLPCSPEDFFDNGKICTRFSRHFLSLSRYKRQIRECDSFVRKVLKESGESTSKTACSLSYLRPCHSVSPMLRSVCEELFTKAGSEMTSRITAVRTEGNLSQYVFPIYAYLSGRALNRRFSSKHLPLASATPASLKAYLLNPTAKIVCLNDGNVSEKRERQLRQILSDSFSTLFPDKSSFEL